MSDRKERIANYIRSQIRKERERQELSQEELAQSIGRTNVTISDIERGKVGVGSVDLALIADRLGRPIQYFLPPSNAFHHEFSYSWRVKATLRNGTELSDLGNARQSLEFDDILEESESFAMAFESTMQHFYLFRIENTANAFEPLQEVTISISNMNYDPADF